MSTDYHLPRAPRALYLAARAGIDAVGVPAEGAALRRIWWYRLRELAARVLAFCEGL